jgi:hypothetical protein
VGVEIRGGRAAANVTFDSRAMTPRFGSKLFAGALLASLLPCAAGVAAVHKPIGDRPGNTSAKDLESGQVPLKPADLQFYLTIMRASVARYEHPTAQDLADLAEDKRLTAIEMADSQKMILDLKAGNKERAIHEDVFKPTPQQSAVMRRGDDLRDGHIPRTLAGNAGMGSDQWDKLRRTIDETIDGPQGYGSADEGAAPKLSAAASARAAKITRALAANRALIWPSAAEIKRLKDQVNRLVIAERGE